MSQRPVLKTTLQISLLAGLATGLWYFAARQAQARQLSSQQTVAEVDTDRIMGTWYELARYPNFFQREDWVGARDHYEPLENGQFKVFYRYHPGSLDAPEKSTEARMWRDPGERGGRFKIQFFWPFVADYWIIDRGDDYEYLVVGYPDRSMLWIMSRERSLPKATWDRILTRLKAQHYDPARLIDVPQAAAQPD